MIYLIVRAILRFFYSTWYRSEIIGLEHIPSHGPVIVCSNHISTLDPPSLGIWMPRKIRYMAKAELFKIPVFGALIHQLGAFPVKRGGVSKDSIRLAIDMLKSGELIGVFPEGTRNAAASGMGKRGAMHLAFKSGATVVPAAILASYKPFSKVKVIYGEPVDIAEYIEQGTSEAQEAATDEVMTRIRKLAADHEWKN